MNVKTLVLWLNAAVFFGFGLACALAPATIAELTTGSIPATTSAITDFRAVYGGMMIGIGLLLVLTTRSEQATQLGLQAILLIMICMAGSRIFGMLTDGSPNQFMIGYLGAEVSMAVISALLLRTGNQD